MFARLGRFAHRHRRAVLGAWLAVLVIGSVLGGRALPLLDTEMSGSPSLESVQVEELVAELTGAGPEIVALVEGAPDELVTAVAQEAAQLDGVVAVHEPATAGEMLRSLDGSASLVVAVVSGHLDTGAEDDLGAELTALFRGLEDRGAEQVQVGGSLRMNEEFMHAIERDLQRGETIALPVAFVAMIVIFGGIVAAGLPLALAIAGVLASMVVLFTAAMVTDVSIFAINVVLMLGIGLGIDYGLLMVSRFREERAAGVDVATAVERTTATAGRTVAFSAMTVAVALAGLFAFDEPSLRSFGIAGIGVVTLSMVAGLTLLPALLSTFHRRIRPAKPTAADQGAFFRLSRVVQRRAVPVVIVVSVGLAALAAPFLHANFENGDARSLPRSSESRAVALVLAEEFPARGADPVVVVARADGDSPEVTDLVERAAAMDGVAGVSLRPGIPAGTAVIDVVPAGTGQGEEARALVHELRSLDLSIDVQVGGWAAALVDFKDSIGSRLAYALAIIAVATFVLLFLMTGSIAVPIKAIFMNLLSLGASFGAMVWIFQDGHLSGVLGFDSTGSIDLFMPVLVFVFAFGLSMDYEVFLLSRIKEIHDQTGDNDLAVSLGLQRTGKIITSAALLIVVVFAGFAAGEVLPIKQLGLGLAIAVIVDATVVRSLLVPATMKLLGERNWWAPAPLRRLHDRFGLSEAGPPSGHEVDEVPDLAPVLVDA